MTGVLYQCPSCGRDVSSHDARCPDCRQVLGADNVCPCCHALTPVLRHDGSMTCSSCESPRRRLPNTVVVSPRELRWLATWERVRLKVYRAGAAAAVLFCALVAAVFWILGSPAIKRDALIGFGLMTSLIVGIVWRQIARERARSKAREQFAIEQRLLGFAYQRQWVVRADEVAGHLGISVANADAMLDDLVRIGKADMDVTDRGEIKFTLKAGRSLEAPARSSAPAAAAARIPTRQRESS